MTNSDNPPVRKVSNSAIDQALIERGGKGDEPSSDLSSNLRKVELVDMFLKNGADVNQVLKDGNTPLHLSRSGEVAQALIDKGANTEVKNNRGETPLDTATNSKRFDVAQVIREAQAEELKEQIKLALQDRPPMAPEACIASMQKPDGLTHTKTKVRRM